MQTSVTTLYSKPENARLFRIVLALCGLVPILVFWGTVKADFVAWDDDINIYGNAHLRGPGLDSVAWAWTDCTYVRRYMPLGWMGWIVNYWVDGLSAATYHLGNVLLHAANSMLLFLLILQLLLALPQKNLSLLTKRRRSWLTMSAGLAALFWAVHPLRVEPVAWASGRLYCQALFFLLISLTCYMRHARSLEERDEQRGFYWCSIAAYAASLLTYPIGLSAVVLFLILDVYPLGRWRYRKLGSNRHAVWQEKIPFVLLAGTIAALTVTARVDVLGNWTPPPTLEEFTVMDRAMQASYLWAYYLWKPWWPLNLSPLYTTLVSFDPMALKFWFSIGLLLIITYAIWQRRAEAAGLVLAWVSYLILMIPLLGLTEHPHFPSDRYSYGVGILWSVLLAGLLWRGLFTNWKRTFALSSCGAVIVLLSIMSERQTRVWRDSETLFSHMIAELGEDEYRFDIYHRLGQFFVRQSRFKDAEFCFRQELEIKKDFPRALFSLGNTLVLQEKLPQALGIYKHLIEVAPEHKQGWLNVGHTLNELGRLDDAVTHFKAAVRQAPVDVDYHLALGNAALRVGMLDLAIQSFQEVQKWDAGSEDGPVRLAAAYVAARKPSLAVAVLRRAIVSHPDSMPIMMDLAWLLATQDKSELRDPQSALVLAKRAVELSAKKDGRALDVLAAAYASAGQFQEARHLAHSALQTTLSAKEKDAITRRLKLYESDQAVRQSEDKDAR